MQRLGAILTVLLLTLGVSGWRAMHVHLAHGQTVQGNGRSCCASDRVVDPCGGHSSCCSHDGHSGSRSEHSRESGEDQRHASDERPEPSDSDSDSDSGCGTCSLLAVVSILANAEFSLDQVSFAHRACVAIRVFTASVPSPRGVWARPPPPVV